MTTTLTMRIDDALKTEANELFEELGLNMTTAFTCFLKKCLDIG
ncbi:MAG: type II toxin-antitoxin system RelB/DinJ family antitoxin, partial [Kiritimatiellae bacterium]|nr:type II toxin-antitoxin system RelB/DinJ family antitoxin [Kiritimatiellia bacterium]